MTNLKHAYLIEAHKDDYVFYSLLKMLDHKLNDIYIHMDAKNVGFDAEQAKKTVHQSHVFFTQRTSVMWGGYSQINAELLLLKNAIESNEYAYYHLLSGQDLPIKSQSYIHDFFEKNNGLEFVRFENESFQYYDRTKYYYWLQDRVGRKHKFLTISLKTIQQKCHINRNKDITFQKGSNWFSITDSLARYVVSKEDWIKKTFHDTICCDEVFLQTIIVNSAFKDRLAQTTFNDSNEMFMRLIDWERGNPYIFTISDLNEIESSPMLFCRKFSSEVDVAIIDTIVNLFQEKQMKG